PYFTHSVAVAMILSEMKVQSSVVAAGLLHDTVEDTTLTLDFLSETFSEEIAKLVDGVTKLTNLPNASSTEKHFAHQTDDAETEEDSPISQSQREEMQRDRKRQLKNETLRKTFIAMVDDVRVIIIKLADRLHNMRTLSHMSREKQKRIAKETLDIYAPLANRLGIWRIKWELEDLALRYVHPDEYAQIAETLATTHTLREKEILEIIEKLESIMELGKIPCEVSGRPKHIYSIYSKMLDRDKPLEMLRDLRGVRLIVKDIPSCYAALGQIHTHWRPIPGEFDDYIAVPKDNFYQSLHTAVYYDDGKPLEVQIRTTEMHQNAEYGIAAHWRYKEHAKSDAAFERRLEWLRQLMDWQKDVEDAGEFIESMKSDVFQERVFVFTPRGDVIDLPIGSTPIDFAYTVHTEVGHRCRGAKVNGKMVPLSYQLKTGDQVSVITTKQGGPSRDWLNTNLGLVNTQRARSKIRAWFKWQDREQNLQQGKEIIKKELQRLGMADIDMNEISQELDFKHVDDLYTAIGCGDISSYRVINKINERFKSKFDQILQTKPHIIDKGKTSEVTVLGTGNVLTVLGKCCNPAPGDEIIGYITIGRGATIHKIDCPNVARVKSKERLVQVSWGKPADRYPVAVTVKAYDRQGLINDITNMLVTENINLENINVKIAHNYANIQLIITVLNISQLSRVLTRIEGLPNVIEAFRNKPG
ncbi:MAG: bifunctional (p)ppGpp synthetase/guanosine-3',5'-bis(diphosphate) 3'-pyrophosphohydrolase, partial [Chloroflexi bacterium]|nr:bifunctional (p)ppGpp synthetase/guanosine-3',5'-bis(diphosphate) 3'-pyrophosphohydrolase [Chloroflexota bacterium]